MQKDFHHATVYVLSRLAGFDRQDSEIIAHSSQYVDDEVNGEVVYFDTGAIYVPKCSAHKIFDNRNFNVLANHLAWVPFHFLPGDREDGIKNGRQHDFEERVVCIKNSPIAREMLGGCLHLKDTPHFLHRIGITLHVYADTWAHQRFSGIQSKLNKVAFLDDRNQFFSFIKKSVAAAKDFFWGLVRKFINEVLPLGHVGARSYPDLPYLTWTYQNYKGESYTRSNADEFMDAARHIYSFLVKCRTGEGAENEGSLNEKDAATMKHFFESFTDEDADVRHGEWLKAISRGAFSFGEETVQYIESGEGSWEYKAIGKMLNCVSNRKYYRYHEGFMTSNWKLFHDALKDHEYFLNRVVFPKYQLCLA